MKNYISVILSVFAFNLLSAQGIDRKILHDCTITFDVRVVDTAPDQQLLNFVHNAVKTSYVKGNMSRNDFMAPGLNQTEIFRATTDTVVVLREVNNQKYISYLDRRKLGEQDKRYEGIRFVTTQESKNILGYECKLVQAQFPDGSYFQVYYAPAIEPSHKAFERQYQELPGLVLEYETFLDDGKTRLRLTATSIDLSPVSPSKFEIPVRGYKVL